MPPAEAILLEFAKPWVYLSTVSLQITNQAGYDGKHWNTVESKPNPFVIFYLWMMGPSSRWGPPLRDPPINAAAFVSWGATNQSTAGYQWPKKGLWCLMVTPQHIHPPVPSASGESFLPPLWCASRSLGPTRGERQIANRQVVWCPEIHSRRQNILNHLGHQRQGEDGSAGQGLMQRNEPDNVDCAKTKTKRWKKECATPDK